VSFDMLASLRPDLIKVEGTVIRKITRSAGAESKLKAILRAGELTGAAVVAECVEDDKVLAALRQLKVGYAQGFVVGRPQPFDDWLKS
jgi:EAL domain-containing protein (putative c-di-GMP-specific phosphodiesterase class I)